MNAEKTQTVLEGEETDFPAPEEASVARRIREPQWDYLRFAATAAVVLIHVLAFAFNANHFHVSASLADHFARLKDLSQALRWAVPSFALLTGVLVWGREWRGGVGAYFEFLRRRAVVVAVPYLLWSVVYYLLRPSLMGLNWPHGRVAPLLDFASKLVDGTVWFHLYFVPIVLVLYLVTPLAAKAARVTPEGLLAGAMALALVWRVFFLGQAWLVAPWGTLLSNVIAYAPFAALGALIALRRTIVRRVLAWVWPLFLAGGLCGLWFGYASVGGLVDLAWHLELGWPARLRLESLGLLIMTSAVLGMLGLCWFLSGRWARADRMTERMYAASFGVYLIHPLVTSGVVALALVYVPAVALLYPGNLVIVWAFVFAISWLLVWLMLKTRVTRWMV